MRVVAGLLVSMVSVLAMGGLAGAASFDCAKAATPDEQAVCDDAELSRLDDRLARAFAEAKAAAAEAGRGAAEAKRTARRFLADRRACEDDASCIRGAYVEVLDALGADAADESGDGSDADVMADEDKDAPPDHASPSVCVVILGLLGQAIEEGRARGDVAPLREASGTFRRMSVALNDGEVGAQQMIGSTVAFYDELTPSQLSKAADLCLAAVDETFTEDD